MQMLLYNVMFNKMQSTEKFQTVNEQTDVKMVHVTCPVGQPIQSMKMIFTHKGEAVQSARVDKLYPFTKLVVSFPRPVAFDGIYIDAKPIYLHQVIESLSSATNVTFEKDQFQIQAEQQTQKDNELVGQYQAIKVQREKQGKEKQAQEAEKAQVAQAQSQRAKEAKKAVKEAKIDENQPKMAQNEPEQAPNEPKQAQNEPKIDENGLEIDENEPKTVENESKTVENEPKMAENEPKNDDLEAKLGQKVGSNQGKDYLSVDYDSGEPRIISPEPSGEQPEIVKTDEQDESQTDKNKKRSKK